MFTGTSRREVTPVLCSVRLSWRHRARPSTTLHEIRPAEADGMFYVYHHRQPHCNRTFHRRPPHVPQKHTAPPPPGAPGPDSRTRVPTTSNRVSEPDRAANPT